MIPKVSIIVPMYNEEKYIRRCIESLLQSTYQDFELILLDDGSQDNSFSICQEFAENNPHIFVYKLNRGGVSKARNYGLDKAVGEYIWFVDGDDKVYPNALEELMNGIVEEDCDLVIGRYDSNRTEAQSNRVGICSIEDYAADFCRGSGFYYHVLWNKLYKRKIIKDNHVKFPEYTTFAEDNIFNCSYLLYCKKVNYIDKKVYYYSDDNSYNKSVEMSLEKETFIINVLKESFNKKKELITKYELKKQVDYIVNNNFFNSIHNENKLMKQRGFNSLLLDTWKSEEFTSVLRFDSGVEGKTAMIAKIAKMLNFFGLYKLLLEI